MPLNPVDDCIHAIVVPFGLRGLTDQRQSEHLEGVARAVAASGIWKNGRTPAAAPAGVTADAPPWDARFSAYQEQQYFHPFVRRFQNDLALVRRFHRTDVSALWAEFDHSETQRFSINFTVLRCELVLFQPDIGVLLLELQCGKQPLNCLQVALDSLRRLYPPYVDFYPPTNSNQTSARWWRGGHCPWSVSLIGSGRYDPRLDSNAQGASGVAKTDLAEKTGPNEPPSFMEPYLKASEATTKGQRPPQIALAAHWRELLAPFATEANASNQPPFLLNMMGDDRAATLTWLAMPQPRNVSRGDFVRLALADDPGTSLLPYAAPYLQDFESRYCYDRFWYCDEHIDSALSPSRLMNSGYAFVWVGSSEKYGFFSNPRNGALATFRGPYIEMGLIAHFQRAALHSASQRLTEMVQRTANQAIAMPNPQDVRDFYEHFVEFTQNFWFDEISPQDQGRDLFDMWRHHLRIQPLYDEVRQELKDLVDYSELRSAGNLNRILMVFGAIALVISYLSLVAAVAGFEIKKLPEVLPCIPEDPAAWLVNAGKWSVHMALAGLAASVIALAIWRKKLLRL